MFITHIKATLATLLITAPILLSSCGGNSEEERVKVEYKQQIEDLYVKAEESMKQNNIEEAIRLTDSIISLADVKVEMLKKAHRLNLEARLTEATNKLEEALTTIHNDSLAVIAMEPKLQRINLPGTDPYLTDRSSYNPNLANQTGISARIDPGTNQIFITASLSGKNGMRYLTLSNGEITASTDTLPKENVTSMSSGDMATFSPTGSLRIALLADSIGSPEHLTLTFHNASGAGMFSRKISPSELKSLQTAKEFSDLSRSLQSAINERSRQTKIIETISQKLQ